MLARSDALAASYVVQSTGDGIFALFGEITVPLAKEAVAQKVPIEAEAEKRSRFPSSSECQ